MAVKNIFLNVLKILINAPYKKIFYSYRSDFNILSILIFAMLSYACADSINLPDNLKSIKTEAFYGDTNCVYHKPMVVRKSLL